MSVTSSQDHKYCEEWWLGELENWWSMIQFWLMEPHWVGSQWLLNTHGLQDVANSCAKAFQNIVQDCFFLIMIVECRLILIILWCTQLRIHLMTWNLLYNANSGKGESKQIPIGLLTFISGMERTDFINYNTLKACGWVLWNFPNCVFPNHLFKSSFMITPPDWSCAPVPVGLKKLKTCLKLPLLGRASLLNDDK